MCLIGTPHDGRALGAAVRTVMAEFAYSGEDDRLFRRNVTGDSAESAL